MHITPVSHTCFRAASVARRVGFLALILVLTPALGSCNRNKHKGIVVKPRHSVNLGYPELNWPGDPKRTLTDAQREVYEARGAPDLIRIWWKESGEFVDLVEVPREITDREIVALKKSWIYRNAGDEVVFDSPVTHFSRPIGDKLGVVIEEGDPPERKLNTGSYGLQEEIWHFYTTGMIYRFRGEKLVHKEKLHQGMQMLR